MVQRSDVNHLPSTFHRHLAPKRCVSAETVLSHQAGKVVAHARKYRILLLGWITPLKSGLYFRVSGMGSDTPPRACTLSASAIKNPNQEGYPACGMLRWQEVDLGG